MKIKRYRIEPNVLGGYQGYQVLDTYAEGQIIRAIMSPHFMGWRRTKKAAAAYAKDLERGGRRRVID